MRPKFNRVPFPYVAVSHAAWLCGDTAIIQAYSFRDPARFHEMVQLVKRIDSVWPITHWCFDWTAECAFKLYNSQGEHDLIESMHELVFNPLCNQGIVSACNIHLIHGDADITTKYAKKLEALDKNYADIGSATHVNKFFYLYQSASFPETPAIVAPRKKFTTFNLRVTIFRRELYKYLRENNLLDQGHCNFAFENYCNIDSSRLSSEYGDKNGCYNKNEELFLSYYLASDFDIVMETASDNVNQRFITEKTIRALAHGQPFVTYNGYHSLELLHSYGFKTYNTMWDESYDSVVNPFERFLSLTQTIAHLINSDVFVTQRDELRAIGEHNRKVFQEISSQPHEQAWYAAKQIDPLNNSQDAVTKAFLQGN